MLSRPRIESTPTRIFFLTLAMGLAVISVAISVIFWMAQEIDAVSQENSKVLVYSSMMDRQERVAALARDYGNWGAAYEWYLTRDDASLFENMGAGATIDGSFDALYIVAADGTAQYGYHFGQEGSDTSPYPQSIGNELVARLKQLPTEPYDAVVSFAMHTNQLTIFAATRLQPDDMTGIDPASLPTLVATWAFTDDRIKEFAYQLLLTDFELLEPRASPHVDRSQINLLGLNGVAVTQLTWPIQTPGATLIRQIGPYLLGLIGLTLLFSLLIARTSAYQTKVYLVEHSNARTDSLTGLLNRSGLNDLVQSKHVQNALVTRTLAVIFIDLNDFKQLNDTLGHKAGDLALRITANRLRHCMRSSDYVARVGGDEFVCLFIGQNPAVAVPTIIDRIQSMMKGTFDVNGEAQVVDAAIGYAVAQAETSTWDSLMAEADVQMYRSKQDKGRA